MTFTLIFIILHVVGLVLIGHVLLARKSHASLILWTLWLLLFPLLGIPLYLVLGTEKIHKKKMERFEQIQYESAVSPDDDGLPGILKDLNRVNGHKLTLMQMPELLWDGDAYYDALIGDIESAQSYIHIQTYVWREDDSGRRVLDALCSAARRDVEVRIMLDEVGSMKTSRD